MDAYLVFPPYLPHTHLLPAAHLHSGGRTCCSPLPRIRRVSYSLLLRTLALTLTLDPRLRRQHPHGRRHAATATRWRRHAATATHATDLRHPTLRRPTCLTVATAATALPRLLLPLSWQAWVLLWRLLGACVQDLCAQGDVVVEAVEVGVGLEVGLHLSRQQQQ